MVNCARCARPPRLATLLPNCVLGSQRSTASAETGISPPTAPITMRIAEELPTRQHLSSQTHVLPCAPYAPPRPRPPEPFRSKPSGVQHCASSCSSRRSSLAAAEVALAEVAQAASHDAPHDQKHHQHHQHCHHLRNHHPQMTRGRSSNSPRWQHHHGPGRRPSCAGGGVAAGGAAARSGPCGASSCRASRAAWCSTARTSCRRRGSCWAPRARPPAPAPAAAGAWRRESKRREGTRCRCRRRPRRCSRDVRRQRGGGAAGAAGRRRRGGPPARGCLPSQRSSGSGTA